MNSKASKASSKDGFYAEMFPSLRELLNIRESWDSFVEINGGDIYFTLDWLETWWKHYGKNRDLRCFLVYRSGRPVAALPLFVEQHHFGPFIIRVAKFVGADFTIPVFTPPIDRRYQVEVLKLIMDYLLIKEECDLVSLSPLSGTSQLPSSAQVLCSTRQLYRMARNDSVSSHAIFALPDSFDDYLGSLAKQTRAKFRRGMRMLSQDHKVSHRAVRGEEAVALFDVFTVMHEEQWRLTKKLGHFGDWPQSAEFTRDLVRKFASKDRVRLHDLAVDGETISLRLGFLFAQRHYARLTARRIDKRWEKASIGNLSLVKTLEALIGEDVRFVEAGPGHYDHKIRHGGIDYPLRRLVVSRNRPAARFKTSALLWWSDLLNLVYYRLWFIRIAPLIGLPRKPLWRAWIRTRL